jgi:hypothetical protein
LKEAREQARRMLAERTLGKGKPESIAFEEAVELFLAACEAENKPRTVADYKRRSGKHVC